MFRTALEIADLHPAALRLPDDHQVIIGAIRFHYLDWGGSGTPILFLHGGGINAHTWDCVAVMLARPLSMHRARSARSRRQRMVTGGRLSDRGPCWRYRGVCRGDGTGTSDRGRTIDGRSQFDRLCDAPRRSNARDGDCRCSAGDQRLGRGADSRILLDSRADSPQAFLERAVKFNPIRDPAVLRRSLYYNLRQTPAGKWTFKHDQRRRSDDAMRSFAEDRARLASELSRIRCPTLVVRGALSDVLTDAAAEKFARSLPDGRWVRVEKSGHNVQGDNPRASP